MYVNNCGELCFPEMTTAIYPFVTLFCSMTLLLFHQQTESISLPFDSGWDGASGCCPKEYGNNDNENGMAMLKAQLAWTAPAPCEQSNHIGDLSWFSRPVHPSNDFSYIPSILSLTVSRKNYPFHHAGHPLSTSKKWNFVSWRCARDSAGSKSSPLVPMCFVSV